MTHSSDKKHIQRPRGDKSRIRLTGEEDDDEDEIVQPPKFIVFVVGGMSYSEMCSAYRVADATGQELAIGSTEIMSPLR